MTREDLDQLIEKCRELSRLIDSGRDEDYEQFTEKYPELDEIINSDDYEDSHQIDRFVEYLENNSSEFIDGNEDDFGYEKNAWNHFLEVEEAWNDSDFMFPNGRDND